MAEKKETKGLPTKADPWTIEYKSSGGISITLNPGIIRKYLVRGKAELVTDQEVVFFMKLAQARGLNPFIGDAYLIKYSQDPAAIVTSVDYFRKRARAQDDCVGWESGIIVQRKDGSVARTHGLLLDGEKLIGGWFKARPQGWEVDFELEVNLSGYLKYRKTERGQELTKFWAEENQPSQIAKVAESQGLRRLWPDVFQGLYSEEEMPEKPMSNGSIDITPKTFDELLLGKDQTMLKEYLDFLLPMNKGKTIEDLTAGAAKDFDKFWSMFETWRAKQPAKTEPEGPTPEEEEANLRAAGMME